MAFFWYSWFNSKPEKQFYNRQIIISTLTSAIIAILGARLLGNLVIFRMRPLYNESLSIIQPYGLPENIARELSSFPIVLSTFKNKLSQIVLKVENRYPSIFYTLCFILTWQLAELFNHMRSIVHFIISII